MLVKPGTVIIEDNCIRIDLFKVTQETSLEDARLEALHWAANEIQEAIDSEENYDDYEATSR